MKCIYCGCLESKVVDSRATEDGKSIRRRRECIECGKRFTTYETVETAPILVVKSSGNRQIFDANKLRNGIMKACEKRPVPMCKIDELVEDIKQRIQNLVVQEISSKELGEMVMNGLKEIDEVAYVRYASVYRQFKDITMFINEIKDLIETGDKKPK